MSTRNKTNIKLKPTTAHWKIGITNRWQAGTFNFFVCNFSRFHLHQCDATTATQVVKWKSFQRHSMVWILWMSNEWDANGERNSFSFLQTRLLFGIFCFFSYFVECIYSFGLQPEHISLILNSSTTHKTSTIMFSFFVLFGTKIFYTLCSEF